MISYLNKAVKEFIDIEQGNKFFLIGVFFLPTALPISALFFLISLFISLKNKTSFSLNEIWNFPLVLSIGLILFSTLNISLINKPQILSEYDISTIWLNLFNWIPIFLYYWGFQNYLKTDYKRFIFFKFLISGSLPVIFSMILQKFFQVYGPFKTLFNSIIWFQKPLLYNTDPISGLFSNPNYACTWLILIFPFTLILLKAAKNKAFRKIFLTFLSITIVYMIFLTGSRNGLLGALITATIFIGYKNILKFTIPLILLVYLENLFGFLIKRESVLYKFFPLSSLVDKLKFSDYSIVFPRLEIWKSALVRIQERPLFGWGGSTFPFLNFTNNVNLMPRSSYLHAQHSHNIILELAHNFGIPLAIILTSTITLLLIKTWSYIFLKLPKGDYLLNKKAWFASSLIIFVNQLSDLTYYDGKISLLIGILFAGLKCIHDEQYYAQN